MKNNQPHSLARLQINVTPIPQPHPRAGYVIATFSLTTKVVSPYIPSLRSRFFRFSDLYPRKAVLAIDLRHFLCRETLKYLQKARAEGNPGLTFYAALKRVPTLGTFPVLAFCQLVTVLLRVLMLREAMAFLRQIRTALRFIGKIISNTPGSQHSVIAMRGRNGLFPENMVFQIVGGFPRRLEREWV